MKFKIFLTVFFIALMNAAYADGAIKACVKYQRSDYSWSHGYKVQGYMLSGGEINRAAKTFNYQPWSHYFVILWQEGGFTAIELPYGNEPPPYEIESKDQRSIHWKLQKGWYTCY